MSVQRSQPVCREAMEAAFKQWAWTKRAPPLGLMTPKDGARAAFEAGVAFAIQQPADVAPITCPCSDIHASCTNPDCPWRPRKSQP